MVDFNKLFEELRTLTPEQRQQRQDEQDRLWREQMQQRIDALAAQVAAAVGASSLSPEDRRFLESLELKTQRTEPFTHLLGGELLNLTERQLGWLRDLARRAEKQMPERTVLTRAQRYGAMR